MLSTEEKRFIRYWEEQRKGGKTSYLALYITIGTFIITLLLSLMLLIFVEIGFGSLFFWIVVSGGVLISSVLSIASWTGNEKRLKKIIRREVQEGKDQDTLENA